MAAPAKDDVKPFPKSLGIRRSDMPQIRSTYVDDFLRELVADGIAVRRGRRPVRSVLPTQARYNVRRVQKLLADPDRAISGKPLIVSSDSYILDGHHRYAALAVLDPDPAHNPLV